VSADGTKLESATSACGAGSGSSKQIFAGVVGGGVGGSATAYTSIAGSTFSPSSEASKRLVVPSAGTFSGAQIYISSSQPGSDLTCKMRVNAVDTSLIVVVPGSSSSGSIHSSTGSANVSSGDHVVWSCTNSSGSTSATIASIAVEFAFN
jgi:hypothetical protein